MSWYFKKLGFIFINRKKGLNSLKHINEIPIIIKPKIDNRYSQDKISTHNKQQYDCLTIENLNDFQNPFHKKYIIIEEAQFFENLYEFVLKQVDNYNKNVDKNVKKMSRTLKNIF